MAYHQHCFTFFFFNDTATTEIYTLSLHDALPIFGDEASEPLHLGDGSLVGQQHLSLGAQAIPRSPLNLDRKSTRLNSSHLGISYAVFCLKKKKRTNRYMH